MQLSRKFSFRYGASTDRDSPTSGGCFSSSFTYDENDCNHNYADHDEKHCLEPIHFCPTGTLLVVVIPALTVLACGFSSMQLSHLGNKFLEALASVIGQFVNLLFNGATCAHPISGFS